MAAHTKNICTLITSYPEGNILHYDGDCETRYSPASTFKIPLALMAFDSGLLQDAHTPSLIYQNDYNGYDSQKKTTDPTLWQKESIVWYSQHLTSRLGMVKFQNYVDQFDYGNMDLSGNQGQDDGLTQSWLSSSLMISPQEQIGFLTRLLNRDLDVSNHAYETTLAIIPEFLSENWIVHGKTGTGNIGHTDNRMLGWFVGWATQGFRKILFSKLIMSDQSTEAAGSMAREQFLKNLPELLPK